MLTDAIWLKIGTQYDLNLERNTVGFEQKSLGFERKLVFVLVRPLKLMEKAKAES